MPDFIGGAESIKAEKIALRTRLLAARRSKTPELLDAAAHAVTATLLAKIHNSSPTVIAAYVPLGPEPGGPGLAEELRKVASAVLLPVLLSGGDLDWARYDGPDSLRPGPKGLLEPTGHRVGVRAIAEAGVVVVPALAVDRRGVRMGRGGGSYDRALARVSHDAFTVALLHDGELVETVPAEPHDRRVRATITPSEGLSETADWTK